MEVFAQLSMVKMGIEVDRSKDKTLSVMISNLSSFESLLLDSIGRAALCFCCWMCIQPDTFSNSISWNLFPSTASNWWSGTSTPRSDLCMTSIQRSQTLDHYHKPKPLLITPELCLIIPNPQKGFFSTSPFIVLTLGWSGFTSLGSSAVSSSSRLGFGLAASVSTIASAALTTVAFVAYLLLKTCSTVVRVDMLETVNGCLGRRRAGRFNVFDCRKLALREWMVVDVCGYGCWDIGEEREWRGLTGVLLSDLA